MKLRGTESGTPPMVGWRHVVTQWTNRWRKFWANTKVKSHQQELPPAPKPAQPFDAGQLAYFVEHGRRSYEQDISFDHWSDRMIIVHGDAVIPYLHEAWKYVKERKIPVMTDFQQTGLGHVNGNGANGRTNGKTKWKVSSLKLHWRTFAGGIIAGSLLCVGLFFAFAPHLKHISTGDARNHIGESTTVVGTVSEIHVTRKGTVLIDMDGRFPNEQFTAVWLAPGAPVAQLQNFDGKTISVKGTIQEYRGRPEIILTSMNQISE